ncbi:Uncharacterised protein [Mycobacterium tuberculosis]|uniref:Uncharacterized protein n=1 Tax=Mycobacterium tuberculosis TaxID=1773 RepID=A0A654U0Y4_MYCTX|nr:Uncharacterised protein [Mycobacterium tuberculosis]CKU11950.1 Uncharacterised protein [Mycobacterium tuberculosis]COW38897.1 Uncharacterised protein [Mycobacterium tuberculosis]CPA11714.1 Uncharacterised protein [Mycobacterium tuberculosis]
MQSHEPQFLGVAGQIDGASFPQPCPRADVLLTELGIATGLT